MVPQQRHWVVIVSAPTTTEVERLREFARSEQSHLWDELAEAIRRAINGCWSMAASNVARRIVEAARLVGPTPYGNTNWSLVAGGVYAAVLNAGGLTAEVPDEEEWTRLDVLMAEHGGTRQTATASYAATVTAINTDRERRWINGEDE